MGLGPWPGPVDTRALAGALLPLLLSHEISRRQREAAAAHSTSAQGHLLALAATPGCDEAPNMSQPDIPIGARVSHPRFGVGEIVEKKQAR